MLPPALALSCMPLLRQRAPAPLHASITPVHRLDHAADGLWQRPGKNCGAMLGLCKGAGCARACADLGQPTLPA